MPTVIIDPGHGGMDPGAVYKGRQEKDDNLRLALAVGELLSQNGVDVLYTRTDDVYDSPYRKAMIANESGADYLISFHRNASPIAGNASGVETLVYADRGVAAQMARDINRELAALGFRDIGVIERPGLAVLRRSRMPAVLIETGFIDNDADNLKFDDEFEEIAAAISNGILETLRNEGQLPDSISSASYPFMFSNKIVFAGALASATVGGAIVGLFNVKGTAYVPAVLAPFMANEGKGLAFVVAMIAAMGCAFVVTMVANMVERRKKEALLLNKQQ